jgi:hypothetical protein
MRARRQKTARFEFDDLDNEEQRLLQQAIKNSLKETKRVERTVPEAPTYRPTLEQFRDPYGYIKRLVSLVNVE